MKSVSTAPFLCRVRLDESESSEEVPAEQPQQEPSIDDWSKDDFPAWYQEKVDTDEEKESAKAEEGTDSEASDSDYALDLAVVQTLDQLEFGTVSVLAGDNGAGKSTLLEAIAVAARFNPEGGSRNLQFSTYSTHSSLADHLVLEWNRTPKWGWFLRAETFYGMASHIAEDDLLAPTFPDFHRRSHGESFLDLAVSRFKGPGLYLLDEPESALSVQGLLSLCALMKDSIAKGAQFILSTHSPLLMAFPDAHIFELNATTGIAPTTFASLESTILWKRFFANPEKFYTNFI